MYPVEEVSIESKKKLKVNSKNKKKIFSSNKLENSDTPSCKINEN